MHPGQRTLTCTRQLQRGARTAMLLMPGLLRVDVIAYDDSYAIRLRKLCAQRLAGGLSTISHRDEGAQRVSAFHVEPSEGDIGRIEVSVTLPANSVGDEVPCAAVAVLRPR